jgi:hypothetical protein
MKSARFVQANVAVNTFKLTSKVPFLFGNFDVFKKNLVKNVQFRYGMMGKSPPPPPPFCPNILPSYFATVALGSKCRQSIFLHYGLYSIFNKQYI